ncbi:MAG: hypothetical protein H7Z37_13295 [Pyrinomonadaceae bacterium]|nr:hypothetical protein [Pyrinomonadaceae bacterium]
MKKLIASLVLMAFFAIMLPVSADAQNYCPPRRQRNRYQQARNFNNRNFRNQNYRNNYYNNGYNNGFYRNNRPSFYRRNRNLINVGVGTGAGALLGTAIGGGRGALIGSLIGAGGSALYTYKIRPKRRRF